MPTESLAVDMPTLQVLEIPMSPTFLDLQACSHLHSLHITNSFELEETTGQSRPVACIIVNLRSV
jgi:hypothetical protein